MRSPDPDTEFFIFSVLFFISNEGLSMSTTNTNNDDEVLTDLAEMTRKKGAQIESVILRRLADVTQTQAAKCMGVHASTVSRMTEDIGKFTQLLAALDLQLATTDSVVVDQRDQWAFKRMAYLYLKSQMEGRRHDDAIGRR